MRGTATDRLRAAHGFTLVELMVVVLIVALLSSIAVPVLRDVLRKGHRAALIADARDLHSALMQYEADNGQFPSTSTPAASQFDLFTLAPLSNNGYFDKTDSMLSRLWGNRVLIYIAYTIDDRPNAEYWLILRSTAEPFGYVMVANTTVLPVWWGQPAYDGVYWYDNGQFVPADEAI